VAPDGKIAVAYVLGQSGSDTGDVFAPYEVLASSSDFHVYTVASTPAPAPVGGGMSVVPAYTFDDVAAGIAPAPGLVVVPAVNSPAGSSEQDARDFVARQYQKGARVLGICAGSRLLAASGILDGRKATSHWSRIAALEESNPEVSWIRGQRYVQDGLITTTGAVTSGIPAALKVMTDMAGDAEAERVGTAIGYPGWSPDAPVAVPMASFGLADVPVLLNAMYPWARPSIGVELRDGVGEIDAGAVFEVYAYSQAARATAFSATGTVTTKHGLVIDTVDPGAAPGHRLDAGHLASPGSGGFDAAFEQLAQTTSPSVVESTGKMLGYPLDRTIREAPGLVVQLRAPLFFLLSIVLAAGAGSVPAFIGRVRRRTSTGA
jgi:putative intracellular protease/amidase